MQLTTLDPNTALFVIDLQKGIVSGNFIHPIADIVDRARALIDVFRTKNLPVVLVNVAGRASGQAEQGPRSSQTFAEGWTNLLPELYRQPSDIAVTSVVGAHSQQRILKPSSKREALPRLLWLV